MNMKRKILLILLVLLLVASLVAYTAAAQAVEKEWPAHWPGRISIGAARIGGSFYQTGSALANAIGKAWPKAEVVVEQTKASVHNIKLIEAGEIAVGLCTTNTAWDGWYGLGVFEKEYREMRLLVPTQACGFLFCTAKKDNINCPTDFKKGMKVSGLMKGSAADVILRNIFETLGVEAEIINMATTDSAEAFKSGLIQGYVLGHPNPSMQEVSLAMDTNIFGVSGELAEKFIAAHPEFIYPVTVPAGYYKGQDKELVLAGYYCLFIVRRDLPEDFVYALVKAMYDHLDIIEATWPVVATTLRETQDLEGFSVPLLHPGSAKYLKEIGVKIPESLIE